MCDERVVLGGGDSWDMDMELGEWGWFGYRWLDSMELNGASKHRVLGLDEGRAISSTEL